MRTDEYLAYYGASGEYEMFQTFEAAEKWLKEQWDEDACEGYSEESCNGGDYIAKITHRSLFVEIENRDKDGYKWNEEASGYFIDGNPDKTQWPYAYESIGKIELIEIKS